MASIDRLTTYQNMLSSGLIPLFYNPDPEIARKVVTACIDGGVSVMEFTNRGDNALTVFAGLVEHFRRVAPGVALGIGSITDAPTAALYIAYGANYIDIVVRPGPGTIIVVR